MRSLGDKINNQSLLPMDIDKIFPGFIDIFHVAQCLLVLSEAEVAPTACGAHGLCCLPAW